MPLYLTIRAGDDPANALPILATTDQRVIRRLVLLLLARLEEEGGGAETLESQLEPSGAEP